MSCYDVDMRCNDVDNNLFSKEKVKEKLSHLLSQEYLDYSAILSLSSELIKFDKDNVRFSVDAGVIDRLGSELVAKQETAVSELIKNAYDADATYVKLEFKDSNDLGGTLGGDELSEASGAPDGVDASIETLSRMVKDLGRNPIERNSIYTEFYPID